MNVGIGNLRRIQYFEVAVGLEETAKYKTGPGIREGGKPGDLAEIVDVAGTRVYSAWDYDRLNAPLA